jgi:hypothetical protein
MLLSNQLCFDELSLYWLSVSSGVRINQNGFLFFDSPVYMPDSHACPRIIGALCRHENYTFMPCTAHPLTRVTDAPPPFESFWTSEAVCAKRASMYDFHITPCDLRHGTSIVWSDGRVSVQQNLDLDYWSNLFVLLIMGWLIINLGESIALVLEVKGSTPHHHNTIVLCVALMSIIVANTPDGFWATYDDIVLYWCIVGYIGLYTLYHIENRNTINVIIGCMMLVSGRYYQTNETPYVPTYLFIISARFFQKCYYSWWGKTDVKGLIWIYIRYFYMAADVALFVMLYLYAFIPSFREPTQAHLYLLGILYSAFCLGSFVATYVRTKEKLNQPEK